jgi:hypothetical protein
MFKRELADEENFGDALDLEMEKSDPAMLYTKIEKRLSYHFELPPERLLVGNKDYDSYMCRTNVINNFTQDVERFIKLKGPEANGVQELTIWINELNSLASQTKDRMKTAQDMERVKSFVTRIVELCKDIK